MNSLLFGLGLFLSVSLLDLGRVYSVAWGYDLGGAEQALKKKDYAKVISLLSPEIEALTREGLFILAAAYSASQNHEAAIKTYTACLTKNPRDFEAKTQIGSERLSAGKETEALSTLREALEINPQYLPAYKEIIRIYEKRKNKYELRLIYQDLLEKFGDRIEYITKLCELTALDGLYDLSLKYCQMGTQRNTEDAINFVYLGVTYHQTGNSKKAETLFKKAANMFPKSELAQMTYAQFLDEMKNFIASYGYYKRAIAANKVSVPALLGAGAAALEIQKNQESLDALSTACSLDKTTLPNLRKATNVLRTLKNAEWLKKFEAAIEKCGG